MHTAQFRIGASSTSLKPVIANVTRSLCKRGIVRVHTVLTTCSRPQPSARPLAMRLPLTARRESGAIISTSQTCDAHVARRRIACSAKPKTAGELEVTQQQLPGNKVKLSIKVPAKIVKRSEAKITAGLTKLIGKVPGFPANKPLPLGLVMDRCGGPKKFAIAVLEDVMLLSYQQVMEQFNNVMYPDSDTMLTKINDLVDTLDSSRPLEYELQFELLPSVKWKQPYKDIEIVVQDLGSEETDVEAADDFIKQELKRKGFQRIVMGRGLQPGDLAVIDLDIRAPGSKQPLPGMSKEMLAFDTEVDPLDLTASMVGQNAGETRRFEIQFPDDWQEEELRGQTAEVTIKMSELFQWVLPAFDAEFVQKHFPQYPSPEAMRQAVINTTAMQRFQQRDQGIQEAFLAQLVKIVDTVVPQSMIDDIGRNEYQRNLMMAIGQGKMKLQEAEALMTEEKVNGYTDANRGMLEDLAKVQLGSQEIIEAEGLAVDARELDAEIADAKRSFEAEGMEYDEERVKEQAEEALKGAALMNWVKANCKVELKPYVPQAAAGVEVASQG